MPSEIQSKRKDNDGIISFLRIFAIWFAKILSKTRITPNQVTVLNFLIFTPLISALILVGGHINLWISLLVIVLTVVIDLADGALARIKGVFSDYGAWLDGSLDNIFQLFLLTIIVLAEFLHGADPAPVIAGILVLFGQGMAHVLGFMFKYELSFDPYSGSQDFLAIKTKSPLGSFLKNIVVPSKFIYIFIFTARYLLVLGLLTNHLDWFLIAFGISINIRWIAMWFLFYFYISKSSIVPELVFYLRSLKKID